MIVLVHDEASNRMFIGTTDLKTGKGLHNKDQDGLIELKKQIEGRKWREIKEGDPIPMKLDCWYRVNLEEISIDLEPTYHGEQ